MSWQDDLRQLDQALAQGQIPADEYRQRRDQLLAAAAGGSPPAAQPTAAPTPAPEQPGQPQQQPAQQQSSPQQPQQPATPAVTPATPEPPQQQSTGSPSGPFAPPFRWEPSNPDATQVVSTDSPEPTQVVAPHSPESDRTQTLRPLGGQQQSQFGQPTPPPWQTQQPDNAPPPWGQEDGPVSMPAPTWLSHGPEVFAPTGGGDSKKGKIALIVTAVVVVIGLGVGAFFLFGNKKDEPSQPQTGQSQSQPPTTTTKPKDNLEVAKLDGQVDNSIGVQIKTFADAEQKGFLTADEVKIYKTGEAGKARMTATTLPNGVSAYILTSELTTPDKAATAADALAQQQIVYGMKKRDTTPASVLADEIDKVGDVPATIRAHYVHNGTVVRIQVYGDDLAKVGTSFDDILKAQLDTLDATG
jgi:hypothetical protein